MDHELIGKSYVFEDGNSIKVTQMKPRDEDKVLVTYEIQSGPGIPRRLVMEYPEFISTFGHLFNYEDKDS
jgi:hypothetical protein